jgi:hypothetical protein
VSGTEKTLVLVAPPRVAEVLRSNCFDCHAGGAAEGDLQLDRLLATPVDEAARNRWWSLLKNIRAGTMPPPDSGYKLSSADIDRLGDWIKREVFEIDPRLPDPGRVTLRRLNRNEYSATIRDLMGVDFNADIAFPPDDTGFGFDNIGDALSLSPLMVEKYLAAAVEIVERAVPKVSRVIPEQKFGGGEFRSDSGERGTNMRLDKAVRVGKSFDVPVAGQYEINFALRAHGSFEFTPQRCQAAITIDGEQVHEAEYGWDEAKHFKYAYQRDWEAGEHRIEVELTPIELSEDERPSQALWAELDVQSVTVRGPADREHWKHPPGYDRFFPRNDPPADEPERTEYAREVLRAFTLKAFRRPADAATVERLVQLAARVYEQPGATFEEGIAQAMIPALASSRFLFRLEDSAAQQLDEDAFPLIDEYALASRLSYFLWSTMPDEELFRLAGQGQLRAQLAAQIGRMLEDPRAAALARNFVGQWLRTRDVEKVTIDSLAALGVKQEYEALLDEFRRSRNRFRQPPTDSGDPEAEKRRARFRELQGLRDTLNAEVKSAMRRETEMLFEYIVRENRSLLELIRADYTFLNEPLAKLYGIPDVKGNEMRRVELPADSPRGGILTQGTMLTVTSNPTRTSPVKRGLYILENVLGTPTPPAPPNVPALEDAAKNFGDRQPSLKELLAAHRESALCSSCHSRMDPLGLALENFNALGMWREQDSGTRIDAAGKLITGEEFQDVRELKRVIAEQRSEDFYRSITEKLMTYALGRGVDYLDEVTLDEIVLQLQDNDGRFNDLVRGIIESSAFQRHRRATQPTQLTGGPQ